MKTEEQELTGWQRMVGFGLVILALSLPAWPAISLVMAGWRGDEPVTCTSEELVEDLEWAVSEIGESTNISATISIYETPAEQLRRQAAEIEERDARVRTIRARLACWRAKVAADCSCEEMP